MFVSALDKPWAETPFPIQGFVVKNEADISRVKAYCDYVYVDVEKGISPVDIATKSTVARNFKVHSNKVVSAAAGTAHSRNKIYLAASRETKIIHGFPVKPNAYSKSVELAKEIPDARRVMNNLIGCLTLTIRQVGKGGQFNVEQLKSSVDDMVDSVIRCPDAFTWLLRLRAQDSQTHDHSMRSSLWAVQFGRHIGLDKEQLKDLCLGTLLKDVGKIKLNRALLNKAERTSEEEVEFRKFVGLGVEQLQQAGFENRRVLNIIKFHCERFDGSGFPKGMSGNRIPFLATVAGIASEFDRMCNPRETGETLAPSKATSRLYEMRNKAFSEELVVEFIQSIGLYPPGTIVELTTGDCGMVLEQDPKSRLAPRLAVFENAEEITADTQYMFIDLKKEDLARSQLSSFGKKRSYDVTKLGIVKDIEPESFGIEYSLLNNLISKPFDAANCGSTLSVGDENPLGESKSFFSLLKERFAS